MKAKRTALLLGLMMTCTLTHPAGAEETDLNTLETVQVEESEPALVEEPQAEEPQEVVQEESESQQEETPEQGAGTEESDQETNADETTAGESQTDEKNDEGQDDSGEESTAAGDETEDTAEAAAEEGSADKFLEVASCTAVKKDSTITVTLETAKAGYNKLYFGKASDSDKTKTFTGKANDLGGYTFTFNITEDLLGTVVPCVPGKTDGTWYTEKDLLLTLPEMAEEDSSEEDTAEEGETTVSGDTAGSDETVASVNASTAKTTGSSSSKKSKSSGSSSSGKSKHSSGNSSSKSSSSSKSGSSSKSSGSSSHRKTGDTSGISEADVDKEKTSSADTVMTGTLVEDESAPEIEGLVYVGTYDNRYAEYFRLHVYEDDYYVLEIALSEEADSNEDTASYLIVPAGLETPEKLPEGMETVLLTEEERTKSPDAGNASGRGNALERYRENVEKLELTGFVDRSADEAAEQGKIEWIIAYGALLGKMDKAMGYLEELLK